MQGSYLFSPSFTYWIYNKNFKNDLPISYKIFALFCRAQRPLGKVFGGLTAFYLAAKINSLLGGAKTATLTVDGRSIFLDLGDPRMLRVPNEIRRKSVDTAMLGGLLKPGDTFIDVGANHGSFAVVAAEAVGKTGLVIAIESNKQLAGLAERSLAMNDFSPAQVLSFACADKNGTATFYRPYSSSGAAGLIAEYSAQEPHEAVLVETRTLDSALDWKHYSGNIVLKIDVEGSEMAVLRGSQEFLSARKPTLIIEINPSSLEAANFRWETLMADLTRFGYQKYAEVTTPLMQANLSDLSSGEQRNVIIFG